MSYYSGDAAAQPATIGGSIFTYRGTGVCVKLDAFLENNETYQKASSGRTFYNFEAEMDRSFNRGYTDYFVNKRTEKIGSWESPKSQGQLIGKLLEVIEESDFDLADSNKDNFEIVATTFPNFYTWGENMYVEITEIENNMSEIKFTSATIFGYSWKRNKKNTDKFFQLFEESLTI